MTNSAGVFFLATASLVAASAQKPATASPALVFDGVTVVDVEQGKLLPAQRVVIQGNRIQAVGDASAIQTPARAQVVDAKGKYLIPGLWDMYVHPLHDAPDIYYPLFVAYGITGIRDAGSDVPLDTMRQWRREVMAGTRLGPPRQILSGPYLDANCSAGPAICTDSTNARHLVDSLQAAGADMIKPRDVDVTTYFLIANEARRLKIPFGGHISWAAVQQGITYTGASDSGARIIDHDAMQITDIFNCCGATTTAEQCQPIADRFRRNDTWWVPTLIAYGQSQVGTRGARAYDRFTAQVAQFWGEAAGADAGADSASSPSTGATDSSTNSAGYGSVAQRVGMPMLAGTDAYDDAGRLKSIPPGLSLHAELAMYVAEGVTPLDALQSATLNPAKFLHATDSLGTVASGRLADLVLLDADPLANITNTAAIRAVVANSRYFDRKALDQIVAEAKAKAK